MKYLMILFLFCSQFSLANNDPQKSLPPLHQAVIAGDLDQIKTLLKQGADINQLDKLMGNSPLHIAAQTDYPEIVQYLLDNGAFINLRTPRSGMTPLHVASWYSKADNIKVLMSDPELNIELKTPAGAKAEDMVGGWDRNIQPHEKALYDSLAQLFRKKRQQQEQLVAQQKILNTVENTSLTDSQKASEIRKLIAEGQDVNQRRPVYSNRNDWHTPLVVAARNGYPEVVKVLLENGADQTIPGYPMNAIAFHKAAYMGHPEILEMLVKDKNAGKVINARGPNNGYTPLHDAIWHGSAEGAQVLIDAGAATDLKTFEGDTPLQLAKRYGYRNIQKLLK